MKKVYRIWALLLMGAILFSCTKETMVNADSIAGEATASITGDGSDNGEESGENEGSEAGSENGESTTPAEKPEFIDNNDWSAYDENEYLIGFGAVDENSVEGSKLGIDFDARPNLTWEGGEEVTVYVPATNKSGTYFYDKTREQFRPNSPEDILAVGDNLAYVYYPADLFKSFDRSTGKATVTMPSAITANTLASLAAKLPMSGIIPSEQGKAYPTVTFRNLCSVMRVRLTGCETVKSVRLSNSNIALTGDGLVSWDKDASDAIPSLVTSGGSTSMTISCGAGGITLDEDTETEFYFLLPPSAATMNAMTVTVTFSQSDDTYTYEPYITKTRSGNMTLARNKVIKLAFRAGFFSGGDGTSDAPYQISTPAQLNQLGQYCRETEAYKGYNETAKRTYFSTAHYVQTADLNCSGVSISSPIGSITWPFYGSYDGTGFTISNYSLSTNGSYQVGLFGKVDGGTIEGVRLQSSSISTSNTESSTINAAGVVGYLTGNGTVRGCKLISSSVSGPRGGGIVGNVDNGSVTNCRVQKGTITTTDGFAGGVVGSIKTGSISGCYCWGANSAGNGDASSVSGPTLVGGIVGVLGADSGTASVSGCYVSNTTVMANGNYAGGVAGYVYGKGTIDGMTTSATVSNAWGAISVSANQFAGGVAGSNAGSITGATDTDDPYLKGLTYKATVSATTTTAGGVAGANSGTITAAYASNTSVTAPTIVGGIAGSSSGSIVKAISRNCTIRAINASSTYGNDAGGIVGSMGSGGSINLSDLPATSGNGNTIKGAYNVGGVCGTMFSGTTITGSETLAVCSGTTIEGTSNNVAAVVGRCSGNITNCIVDGSNSVSGVSAVGGIAGYVADGASTILISGCTVNGTQNYTASTNYVAGIAASVNYATNISNCTVSGTQNYTTAGPLGGITAYAADNLTISECTVASISITRTGDAGNFGGILGQTTTGKTIRVTSCTKSGTFNGGAGVTVGGIVGWAQGTNTQIDNCTNTGTVNGKYNVGGIVGSFDCSTSNSFIFRSRNTANVTASGYRAGGIAGCCYGGIIKRCYSSSAATIQAPYGVGGLVGYMGATNGIAALVNSSSKSKVTSTLYGDDAYNCSTGGLVGQMYSGQDASNDYSAYIANCVRWGDTDIKNTYNSQSCICIGGIVGYMNQGSGSNTNVIRNCYVQLQTKNLLYKTDTQCDYSTTGTPATPVTNPEENAYKYGGIFGHLQFGKVYDCYYRNDQPGLATSGTTHDTCIKIDGNVKNGTQTFSPKLSNGTQLTNKLLVDALTAGTKTGSGTRYTFLGESMCDWTTYNFGSNPVLHFALPTVIQALGADFYSN